MSKLIVDGHEVDLPENFSLRMIRNNSMFLDDVLEGDYSYTIALPATNNNKQRLLHFHLPESTHDGNSHSAEYIEGDITLVRGSLTIKKANDSVIECYILSGLSKLSNIKDSNIGILEYGGIRNISGGYQQVTYQLTAPDIGGNIQFSFKNGLTSNITLPWNVDANTTLNDLRDEILILAPTQYPGLTITVIVLLDAITIIGEWVGGFPLLQTAPITGSWTAGSISIGAEATKTSLVDHMNEVMDDPENHDFLYVPIYNLKSGVIDQSAIPPEELEETFINFYHFGSFILDYRYDGGGLVPSIYVPVCPFPRVFYILKEMLKYAEFNPEGPVLEDEELYNLLIYTTHCLHRADVASLLENNLYALEFKIGDLLPRVTVQEFLQSLRTTFGIQLFFNDVTRKAYVETFEDLISEKEFIDWTSKLYNKPTVRPCEPTGYIFKFTNDENDDFIEELVQPIENLRRLPDIDAYTLGDLATLDPKANDIVLTRREKNYYRANFSSVGTLIGWDFHSVNFHELKIGDGKTTIETGAGSLTLHRGPYSVGAGESWLVPQAKQLLNPITPFDWAEKYNEFGLRFFFYRGFIKDSADHEYPFASFNDIDYNNDEIPDTKYVLTWEGEKGLYNKFWKKYCEWRLQAKEVEMLFNLTIIDWMNLDFRQKIQVNGVNYFIKSVDMSFPVKNPARATLVKV